MSKVARYDQGSILAPMFSLMVCIRLRGRRQKGRQRGGRGEGEGNALFSPSPFCAPMFSSEYVLDCVAGVRRRGRGGGGERKRKRERGMRFSPPPPPPLSPLFVPATKTRYVFMKRLSKPCYTSFTFSIGPSLRKL